MTQITGQILFQLRRRRVFSVLLLIGFALAAYLIAVGPRWSLANPTHVDEWTNLTYSEAIIQEGHVPHIEPLYGLDSAGFRPELGFRVALAEFHLATGIDWEDMFPALPGMLFVAFAIAMLYLGRLLGAGPLVGILALGTPTTIRFLGPGLVVPVALALTLLVTLPIILLQSSLQERWRIVVLVGIILLAELFVHPPTALVAAITIIAVAVYLAMQRTIINKRPLMACAALGLLLPLTWFLSLSGQLRSELLSQAALDADTGQGMVTNFAYYAGYFRIALFTIALFSILLWRIFNKTNPIYLAILGVYVVLLAYIGMHAAGILPAANFYDRSWLYLDVVMSVAAGVGLAVLAEQLMHSRHRVFVAVQKASPVLVLALIGLIMANAWYVRVNAPSYYLASEATSRDFRWIGSNLSQTPGLTLIDPFMAVSYPAIAGRPVYASAAQPRPSSDERIERALELLATDSPDVSALLDENISIVYKPGWQGSEGIEEVYPGVFIISGG